GWGGRPLGGGPRLRFWASTLPMADSSPPQTPHGSRRPLAASRQASRTGHARQKALARAMSSSCSEKNRSMSDAEPSRHRASSRQLSSSVVWMANIALLPLSSVVVSVACCLVVVSVGRWSRNAERPPPCPPALLVLLR